MTFLFNLKSRYIKVPKDKLLVIHGKVNEPNEGGTQIVKSGSMFVWPVIQDYAFLDTTTRKARLEENFTTKDNKSILIKGEIVYSISRDDELAVNASRRLVVHPGNTRLFRHRFFLSDQGGGS